jgi:hypothetical protein
MTVRAALVCLTVVGALLPLPDAAGAEPPVPVEAQLRDILERPLFARSRQPGGGPVEAAVAPRPPDAVVQEPRAVPAEDIAVQVMGVLIAPPTRKALLRFGDAPPEWLAEGASAEGWRVSLVEEAGVVLTGAAGDVRLDLHEPPR